MKKMLLITVISAMLLSLAACGGLQNYSRIIVTDPISSVELNFPLKIKAASHSGVFETFHIAKSPQELAEVFKTQQSNYSVELYSNKYILLQSKDSCFIVGEIEKSEESPIETTRYTICSPMHTFLIGSNNHQELVKMYIPYHLLEAINFSDIYINDDYLSGTITYKTTCDKKSFYKFYSKLDRYDVKEDNNSIIVSDRETGNEMQIVFSVENVDFKIL